MQTSSAQTSSWIATRRDNGVGYALRFDAVTEPKIETAAVRDQARVAMRPRICGSTDWSVGQGRPGGSGIPSEASATIDQ
jgi:hypothetical protein